MHRTLDSTLRRAALALAVVATTSCHDSTTPACGTLDVKVTLGGSAPVFSWTPRTCVITDLTVWNAGFTTMWRVYVTPSDTLISPDVTYGVTPPSAHVAVAPKALVAGQTYTVDLLWQGSTVTYGGSTTFVP